MGDALTEECPISLLGPLQSQTLHFPKATVIQSETTCTLSWHLPVYAMAKPSWSTLILALACITGSSSLSYPPPNQTHMQDDEFCSSIQPRPPPVPVLKLCSGRSDMAGCLLADSPLSRLAPNLEFVCASVCCDSVCHGPSHVSPQHLLVGAKPGSTQFAPVPAPLSMAET